jgi:hypothetical protein
MDTKSIKELFDKYILIWIWSIFVSINTALSYNIFNLYNISKWEKLNTFLIPLYILAVIMALASWLSLFNFFKIKILSLVMNLKQRTPYEEMLLGEDEKEYNFKQEYKENVFAYRQLKSAFNFIIFAIFFRFLIPIFEMVFGLFYN